MKKSKQETAETRKRIVQAAAAEFRGKGMNGVGLSEVMAAAGLTHGGFYRHFDSKEQLVTEALGMNFITERMKDLIAKEPEKNGLETVVKTYVSPMHRDNRSRGCFLAALGSEIARSNDSTRAAATEGYLRIVDVLASQYKDLPRKAARQKALVAVATMVGAVTLSRMVTDPELSATILKETEKQLIAG